VDTLFTIGHSNHPLNAFLSLLERHGIEAIADVRFQPYSRHVPHFNPRPLAAALKAAGVRHVPLGAELGARPDDPAVVVDGRVSHDLLAARPAFQDGLRRLREGASRLRLAVMCTEKDPLDCHRFTLIGRHLRAADLTILHILSDGTIEDTPAAERRLCRRLKLAPNLLEDEAAIIERAYEVQSRRIAFVVAGRPSTPVRE
jgi:uncharacterized protein (DUF488 family)